MARGGGDKTDAVGRAGGGEWAYCLPGATYGRGPSIAPVNPFSAAVPIGDNTLEVRLG